jgi:hypothetical protein
MPTYLSKRPAAVWALMVLHASSLGAIAGGNRLFQDPWRTSACRSHARRYSLQRLTHPGMILLIVVGLLPMPRSSCGVRRSGLVASAAAEPVFHLDNHRSQPTRHLPGNRVGLQNGRGSSRPSFSCWSSAPPRDDSSPWQRPSEKTLPTDKSTCR